MRLSLFGRGAILLNVFIETEAQIEKNTHRHVEGDQADVQYPQREMNPARFRQKYGRFNPLYSGRHWRQLHRTEPDL